MAGKYTSLVIGQLLKQRGLGYMVEQGLKETASLCSAGHNRNDKEIGQYYSGHDQV